MRNGVSAPFALAVLILDDFFQGDVDLANPFFQILDLGFDCVVANLFPDVGVDGGVVRGVVRIGKRIVFSKLFNL